MKKIINILACISVLASTGCIKETLPQGSTQTAAQVSNSEFALSGLINAIPAQMSNFNAFGFYDSYDEQMDYGIPAIHLATEYMLDDCVILGEPGYNQFYYYYYNSYQGPRYYICSYFWLAYYTYIKACNDAIKLIGTPSTPDLEKYLGQAYAFRAMCYLDLARLYEAKENKYTDVSSVKNLTVPKVTEETTEEASRNNPRLPRKDMYEFIISDLKKAFKLLDGKEADYKAPCADAVRGLLARTYLEMGYWGETEDANYLALAATEARAVIDGAAYEPLSQAEWEDPTNGFNSGKSNSSWILGLTLDSQNTNNLCNFTAIFSNEASWGYGPYTFPGIPAVTYSKIATGDFRQHSWYDPASSYAYKLNGTAAEQKHLLENAAHTCKDGYFGLKFRPAQGQVSNYTTGCCADHPLMRVEELYFIEMEAKASAGDVAAAKTLLKDFMDLRVLDGTYSCDAITTAEEFIEEMMFQKRIEFWGEGILMYDYKRLNKGIVRNYEGTNWPASIAYNTDGRSPQWNICIVRSEAQANAGIPETQLNPDPTNTIK